MPIDAFKCTKCGHIEEHFRKNVNDEAIFPEKCEECSASGDFIIRQFGACFDVGAGLCGNAESSYGNEITYKPSTKYGFYKTYKKS